MDTVAKEEDNLASAKAQGQAQFDSIKDLVDYLNEAREADAQGNVEDAERQIHEDALSVQVRSGWYTPGGTSGSEQEKPEEYEILLCTGGSACRIIGTLSEHGEPETAILEVQDWFTPWTAMRPLVSRSKLAGDYNSEPVLLAYARCFWFGE